jgi:hypothetical protein
MAEVRLSCFNGCPFVETSDFRPCTTKVAHGHMDPTCVDNIADNVNPGRTSAVSLVPAPVTGGGNVTYASVDGKLTKIIFNGIIKDVP